MGAAFKKDVNDPRNSPSVRLMELLLKEGARLEYHDPYVREVKVGLGIYSRHQHDITLTSVELDETAIAAADCVVITVAHSSYDFGSIARSASLVVDTVNAMRSVSPEDKNHVVLI